MEASTYLWCFADLLLFIYIGTYELLPYYKGENTVFDVSPSSLVVSVEHEHLTILQKFEVRPPLSPPFLLLHTFTCMGHIQTHLLRQCY
jgi:hypothetical protein